TSWSRRSEREEFRPTLHGFRARPRRPNVLGIRFERETSLGGIRMHGNKLLAVAFVALLGCASTPAPTERMATAEASIRGAQEVGATGEPQAALHLRLAQEQLAKAKGLIASGDNEAADRMLLRARADGELALALARANAAQVAAQQSLEQI